MRHAPRRHVSSDATAQGRAPSLTANTSAEVAAGLANWTKRIRIRRSESISSKTRWHVTPERRTAQQVARQAGHEPIRHLSSGRGFTPEERYKMTFIEA